MNTVVTGGAGFIGSHLVDRLAAGEWGQILVLDNLYRGQLANLARQRDNPNVRDEEVDIRDYPALLEQTRDMRPAHGAEVARFTADVQRMRMLLGLEPPEDPLIGLARIVNESCD
jgi:dTDP-D-glucose 4,6-dehydratase